MLRVWCDALTAKDARLCAEIWRRCGEDVLVTCREYDYTCKILEMLNVPHRKVGRYGGGELKNKLIAYFERGLELLKCVGDFDVHVSLASPEGVRIAFGLGKRIFVITDTAHAYHVNKLVLPYANYAIIPAAIPREAISYALTSDVKLIQFNGIIEVAWVKHFKEPGPDYVKKLGLEPEKYVIVRTEEVKASYYVDKGGTPTLVSKIVKFFVENGYKVVAFCRYREQLAHLKELFGDSLVYVEKGAVDTLPLYKYAALVVTGGSTMAHEAALLGTPAISLFPRPYFIDEYLSRIGLPFWRVSIKDFDNVLKTVKEALKLGKVDTSKVLRSLEDPVKIFTELLHENQ